MTVGTPRGTLPCIRINPCTRTNTTGQGMGQPMHSPLHHNAAQPMRCPAYSLPLPLHDFAKEVDERSCQICGVHRQRPSPCAASANTPRLTQKTSELTHAPVAHMRATNSCCCFASVCCFLPATTSFTRSNFHYAARARQPPSASQHRQHTAPRLQCRADSPAACT